MNKFENQNPYFSDRNRTYGLKINDSQYFMKAITKSDSRLLVEDPTDGRIIPREAFFLRLLNESNITPKFIDLEESSDEYFVKMEYLTVSVISISQKESFISKILRRS